MMAFDRIVEAIIEETMERGELKQRLEVILDEKKRQEITRQIRQKQVEFSLSMEQHKREVVKSEK
jgi:hypothetical protein